jgi:hypothetical protein
MEKALLIDIAVRLLIAAYVGVGIWLTLRVVTKAGFAWWWALLPWAPSLFWIIPRVEIVGVLAAPVPLILLWVFAFAEWPSLIDTSVMGKRPRGLTMSERDIPEPESGLGAQTQLLGAGGKRLASAEPDSMALWLMTGFDNDGHIVRLEIAVAELKERSEGMIIGRHPQLADLIISDDSVSRRHALVREKGGKLTVADLGSANGTAVDGERLAPNKAATIDRGAEIEFGAVTLTVSKG